MKMIGRFSTARPGDMIAERVGKDDVRPPVMIYLGHQKIENRRRRATWGFDFPGDTPPGEFIDPETRQMALGPDGPVPLTPKSSSNPHGWDGSAQYLDLRLAVVARYEDYADERVFHDE